MGYLLGIDGGNTKTDYLLCTEAGEFVDVYRTGTCSHEHTSYDGMEYTMRGQLNVILSRNNISVSDIIAGGFGLAGADYPSQVAELTKRVEYIGIRRFSIANDGILGVKASSENGVGICVVNGTSTVVVGIDPSNKVQQVGGTGVLAGDLAGGVHAFRRCLYYLFKYYYRCGENSSIFAPMMEILNLTEESLMEVEKNFWDLRPKIVEVLQLADREAQKGDPVTMSIFDTMAMHMGHTAAGCARRLNFGEIGTDSARSLPVVLVGTLWHKIKYPGMREVFEKTVTDLTQMACQFIPLDAPAAVGGVLWAKEMLDGKPAPKTYRDNVLGSLTMEKYESLVYKQQ